MSRELSVDVHNAGIYTQRTLAQWQIYNAIGQSVTFNNPENRIQDLLDLNDDLIHTAIDIGCGSGWVAEQLTRCGFQRVVGIDPSRKAIEYCKTIYPDTSVEWFCEYAELIFDRLNRGNPTFFNTCSVFMHMDNKYVEQILSFINQVDKGILNFQELFGPDSNIPMQHCRSRDWWANKLCTWELDFHGPPMDKWDLPGMYKGIHGVKRCA